MAPPINKEQPIDEAELLRAANLIQTGQTVAFPTETVYGLGANALDACAVAQIFAIKERPRFDPLIVHVAKAQDIESLVQSVPAAAQALLGRFWPGPLTVVLPKTDRIPDIVTAGLPTVALRMPDHPVARELIRKAGVPVAAPSANPFGHISPTCAHHVEDQLGGRVAMILDGGPCRVGLESTIVTFDQDRVILLRAGGTAVEALSEIVGDIDIAVDHEERPQAPGRLLRHYAPRTPLRCHTQAGTPPRNGRFGLLTLQPTAWDAHYTAVEILSPSGSLTEAATQLFAAMRRLDQLDLDGIEAVTVAEVGLGRAINDRLRRAARHPQANPSAPNISSQKESYQ